MAALSTTELVAAPSAAASARQLPLVGRRTGLVVRLAALGLSIGAAYHESLLSLVQGLFRAAPLAYLGLVPAISLVLAATEALARYHDREIHDRYLDYILGLPLLLLAGGAQLLLPPRLSIFYWFWRLDLLSMSVFVAGAVCLLFGTRNLWRYRRPIGFLALGWLAAFLQTYLGRPDLRLGPLPLVLPVLAVFDTSLLRRAGRRPARRRKLDVPQPRAVRSFWTASLVALAFGGSAYFFNSALAGSESLVRTGQVRVLPFAGGATPTGAWTADDAGDGTMAAYFPASKGWRTYAYLPTFSVGLPPASIAAHAVDARTASDLSAYGVAIFDGLARWRPIERRAVDLGSGVSGESLVYADARGGRTWFAVTWDWPVRTSFGTRYERVVITSLVAGAPLPASAGQSRQEGYALPVADWLDGPVPTQLDRGWISFRNQLVEICRGVVESDSAKP